MRKLTKQPSIYGFLQINTHKLKHEGVAVRLRFDVRHGVMQQSRPESKRHSYDGKTTSAVLFTGRMNTQQTWASVFGELFVCGRLAWDDVMPSTDRTAGLITQSDAAWRRATTDLHTHTRSYITHTALEHPTGVCMCDRNRKSNNTSFMCVCEGVSVVSNICNSAHESQSFWGQTQEEVYGEEHGTAENLKRHTEEHKKFTVTRSCSSKRTTKRDIQNTVFDKTQETHEKIQHNHVI